MKRRSQEPAASNWKPVTILDDQNSLLALIASVITVCRHHVQMRLQWQWARRSLVVLLGIVLVISLGQTVSGQAINPKLPSLRPHPLPSTLAQWNGTPSDDYFDQVKPTSVGYLIWSHFPVTIYVQPPTPEEDAVPFTARRAQSWGDAVTQAVHDWNRYLPLKLVDQVNRADIAIWRSPPPLRFDSQGSGQQGKLSERQPIVRARSAETRFELYQKDMGTELPILAHRFTIQLRPDQAPVYLLAAARHELGHALGIWGHSPEETDALYFSQVRNPPPISKRDISTLRRVYEQPTRLGWALTQEPQ